MTPQSREKTAKTAVFRQRRQAWKLVRSIAAVRQRPRTPRNWRCSFAFFESFLWHFNEKQRAEVIFRHSRPVSWKNQENGAGKQWSLHAPLKLGVVSSLCGTTSRKHRRIEQQPMSTLLRSYSQVFLVFFLQVQILFYILSSWATSQVRRAVSLSVCIVPVNCKHCCLEEDPSRPTISFPWAVLCVVDSLSLILVGQSKGKTHETMKRRQVHHTSTSSMSKGTNLGGQSSRHTIFDYL